jgi:hypothetical protein
MMMKIHQRFYELAMAAAFVAAFAVGMAAGMLLPLS